MLRLRKVLPPSASIAYASMVLLGSIGIVLSATLGPLSETYGVSLVRAGLLVSSFGIGRTVIQLVCGVLADRYGRQRVALVGMGAVLLFYVLMPLCSTFSLAIGLCAICGIGFGMINTSMLATLHDTYAPMQKNATAQSYVQVAFAGGAMITPLLVSSLQSGGLSYGSFYYGSAIATVLLALFCAKCAFPPVYKAPAAAAQASETTKTRLFVEGLALSLCTFFVFGMGVVCNLWLPSLYTARSLPGNGTLMLSVYGLGGVCGTFVFVRLLRKFPALSIIRINPAIAMICLVICIATQSRLLFIPAVAIAGATIAIVFNLAVGVGGALFGGRAATITSMLAMSTSIATLITPILCGWLFDAYGLYAAMALLFVYGIAACLCATWLSRRVSTG